MDGVTVSVYPGKEMTPKQVRTCHKKARRHGTILRMGIADEFRESHSEVGTKDISLIKKLYRTCLIVNCHTIEKGFFFKCPPSVFLPRVLNTKFRSPQIDGIKIVDSPSFGEELRTYLESPYPLASCKHWIGWEENFSFAGSPFGMASTTRVEIRRYGGLRTPLRHGKAAQLRNLPPG